MFNHSVSMLADIITGIILAGGYGGLVLLMAIESACLPLPSEIIMPFAGYLASTGHFNLWLAGTAGALGCNLGSAVAFELGAAGGLPLLRRVGRYVLVSPTEIDRSLALFRRYGSGTVFVCRLLPIIRTYIALPAGIARMNRLRFHAYTFLGSWIWCMALAWAGFYLGQHWSSSPALRQAMHGLDALALLLIVGLGVWFVLSRRRAASP